MGRVHLGLSGRGWMGCRRQEPSIIDMYEHPAGYADFTVASDHYHRFEEDIALFAQMGLKAYRFSIAWTRILLNGTGEVNRAGVEHYRAVIRACRKYDIEPIVTMYHFDLPWCLEQQGGWLNRATIDAFEAYCRVLFGVRRRGQVLADHQRAEHHDFASGCHRSAKGGVLPSRRELYQMNHHMMLAQARVMKLCHAMCRPRSVRRSI